MKKLRLITKTLLVAAMLLGGASIVWAQTTVFSQDFTAVGDPASTDPSDYGFTVSTSTNCTATVTDGKLSLYVASNSGSDVNSTATASFTPIEANNLITFSCVWNPGGPTGTRPASHLVLQDGNGIAAMTLTNDGQAQTLLLNGTQIASSSDKSTLRGGKAFNVVATLNLATQKITSLTVTAVGESSSLVSKTNVDFENTVSSISKLFCKITKKSNSSHTATLDDVNISYLSPNCIINAVDASNNVLMTLAAEYNDFTANASINLYYPRATKIGGTWYNCAANSSAGNKLNFGKTFTDAGTQTVKCTVADFDYYSEVDDMHRSGNYVATSVPDRFSMHNGFRLYNNAYIYTDPLEGGFYQFVTRYYHAKSTIQSIPLYERSSEGTMTSLGVSFSVGSSGGTSDYTGFTTYLYIPDGHSFAIYNNTGYNSNIEFDYVILKKIDSPTISATITSAGFATFSSPYALDFAGLDVKAYTASLTGDTGNKTVLLTPIEKVPANTGVLLKGDAKTYSVPVIASATFAETNLFKASENAEIAASTSTLFHYVLANNSTKGVGFYNLAAAKNIGTGKAYLETTEALAATSEARVAWMFADEDATGITAVSKTEIANDRTYNLNGQRVTKPQHGLYIVNGKKVVIK